MAIAKSIWRAKLNGTELHVVREDQNPEIIFSVTHTDGSVTERTTFRLPILKAIDLARFLANVTTLSTDE